MMYAVIVSRPGALPETDAVRVESLDEAKRAAHDIIERSALPVMRRALHGAVDALGPEDAFRPSELRVLDRGRELDVRPLALAQLYDPECQGTSTPPRPWKPWGCGSRRCRRRTWRSSPGHAPLALEDSEHVNCSPTKEFIDHVKSQGG